MKMRAIRNATVLWLCSRTVPAFADVEVWKDGDRYLDMSALLQIQGRLIHSEGAGTTPGAGDIFFRRLRPAISGALDRDWIGIIEIDFGTGFEGQDPKTSIKQANIQYLGFEDDQASSLTLGSQDPAFGREFLTPSTHLLTVEQTFQGINWYGTPDLTMGAGLRRVMADRKLSAQVVSGTMSIRQEPDRIWFQSPQNQTDTSDNTGYLAAARVDVAVLDVLPAKHSRPSEIAFDPNDLHHTSTWQANLSAAGYYWWNNDDNNQPTTACPTTNDNVCPKGLTNVDHVYGGELSGSVKGEGFAAVAEYQRIHGVLQDRTFDGGLYRSGKTNLDKLSATAGYMIYGDVLELAASESILIASNFPGTWYSTRGGINWFVRDHALQLSGEFTYNANAFGTEDAHEDIGRIQAQLAW